MLYEDGFTSQVIQAIAYDAAVQRLFVFFVSGGSVYAYEGVPLALCDDWLAAPSKGTFFRERIRSTFRAERLSASERRVLEGRIAAEQGARLRERVVDWLGW